MRAHGLVALAWLGCATAAAPARPDVPAPEVPPPTATAPAPASRAVPRCGADADAPRATDFGALVEGSRHHAFVRWREPGEWAPEATLDMPLHHASRLEWTNLDDFGPLAEAATRAERLRVTFRVLGRAIEHDPDRATFFATYTALIETLCSPDAPASRAAGAMFGGWDEDVRARCAEADAAVAREARALAACASDAECAILPVSQCAVEGIDCYWVAGHRGRSRAALDAALAARVEAACPLGRCDCDAPPTEAACVEGRCSAR